jgi:hypothetical protein
MASGWCCWLAQQLKNLAHQCKFKVMRVPKVAVDIDAVTNEEVFMMAPLKVQETKVKKFKDFSLGYT